MDIARVFTSGNSQAVRLPKRYRVNASAVFIRQDAATGDIVLSSRPATGGWADFFAVRARTRIPDDFLVERPLNRVARGRDPFDVNAVSKRREKPAATRRGKS